MCDLMILQLHLGPQWSSSLERVLCVLFSGTVRDTWSSFHEPEPLYDPLLEPMIWES